MKIYLIRHGKPQLSSRGWVNVAGYGRWLREYRNSDIVPDPLRAAHVSRLLPDEATLLCSDLKRARQTAQAVLGRRQFSCHAQFRELELPLIRLPLTLVPVNWLLLSRTLWFGGISGWGESFSEASTRVKQAVHHLEQQAERRDVVLFAHALFNLFTARELKKRGWRGDVPLLINHWQVVQLERDIPLVAPEPSP